MQCVWGSVAASCKYIKLHVFSCGDPSSRVASRHSMCAGDMQIASTRTHENVFYIIYILADEVCWLCLKSHRQWGHLETWPPLSVPCKGCEARLFFPPWIEPQAVEWQRACWSVASQVVAACIHVLQLQIIEIALVTARWSQLPHIFRAQEYECLRGYVNRQFKRISHLWYFDVILTQY